MVIGIIAWEGVSKEVADKTYETMKTTLPEHGIPDQRGCGNNKNKTCACQGLDDKKGGASYR